MCGCQSNSPEGGSVVKGEAFRIAVPTFTTEIKQGEVQSVPITLERGDSFKQDVTLKITALKGIGIKPTKLVIKAGDSPIVQVRISAAKDAAFGEYRVSVTGTPTVGEATSMDFNVKVVAPAAGYTMKSDSRRGGSVVKDEGFKIAAPTFNTKVNQGDTQSVTISLVRGASFQQDVTLEIKSSKGEGLTFDPAKIVVKASDSPDVQIRISATNDAAIGEYRVSVTGTPETGAPTSTEFNVEVAGQ
jgi:uncharacterized membrane protein